MRIARLEMKAIGPFDDAVLEIPAPAEGQRGELVIFEGPNGSGKTTIAQAIACAAGSFTHMPMAAPAEGLSQRFHPVGGNVDVVLAHQAQSLRFTWTRAGLDQVLVQAPGIGALLAHGNDEATQRLDWTALAFGGHQPTPVVATKGPAEIASPPLGGALSFGTVEPASAHLGQLLVNLDQEVAKAFREAHREGLPAERRRELERLATSRQGMLDEIARALSEALAREVTFEVPVGQHAPTISIDGEATPLHLLGEGMRSTLAWLADLLVRLHRIPWEDAARSPLEQDFWLILDEIDESLHPTMQMRILPVLRRLFPNARMYVTTHSPFVVASVGEGYVFPIRPDARHHVSGAIAPRKLERGQSLEWVIEEIFGAETGFIDAFTRDALRTHRADIGRLRRKDPFGDADWRAFLARRAELTRLNEQVQTVVAMQEVPVQRIIDARLAEGAREAEA